MDNITTTTATTTTTTETSATETSATETTTYDGEHLGVLVFDVRADWARHSGGLWVYPATYDSLRDCRSRAAHLTAAFGVPFFALRIQPHYLAAGASPAINQSGYYCATTAESTPALRRIITRAHDRARAMTPRATTAESEESRA